ncbi:MAG: hypothetical protein NTU43_03470, partial [Bacteroidetes bacterium]|nr:hypothetical protein [Bacteroidota bacterium]
MRNKIYLLLVFLLCWNISYSQFCNYASLTSKPNLVINGDFELDNTGFTSQYTYIPSTTLLYEEKYTFTTNANLVHFAWT